MAYDENKVTNLNALKALAERVKGDFATEAELDAVSKRIDDIVSEGGEPNVIDTVKVNGVALEVVAKAVDVIVPTSVSELMNDAGYATEDDVAMAIAQIVADAPESFDTLKEIADWIETHAESAAEMNSQIKTNSEDIEELAALVGELPAGTSAKTIVDYINECIEDIDLTDYLQKSDIATEAEVEEMLDEVFGVA